MSDRKRSPNWQMPEKLLLVDLINDHFEIVENKRTDAVTMKQKSAEWVKISDKFNSQTSFAHRTAENLKAQWESLKKITKKEASAARQSMIQTGGGPAKPKCNDPLYNRIMAMLSTAVVGLVNEYDSDINGFNNNIVIEEMPKNTFASVKIPDVTGDVFNPVEPHFTSGALVIQEPKDSEQGDTAVRQAADWGDYTPRMLQSPKSAALQSSRGVSDEDVLFDTPPKKNITSRRRPAPPVSRTQEDWHKKKIQAIEMQMRFAEEEREEGRQMFDINLKIKEEMLKQEKIKRNLLLKQLRQTKKKTSYNKNKSFVLL